MVTFTVCDSVLKSNVNAFEYDFTIVPGTAYETLLLTSIY